MTSDQKIAIGSKVIDALKAADLSPSESLEILARVAAPIIQDAVPRLPMERRINAITKFAEYVAKLVACEPDDETN